jgi:hypothetical protein
MLTPYVKILSGAQSEKNKTCVLHILVFAQTNVIHINVLATCINPITIILYRKTYITSKLIATTVVAQYISQTKSLVGQWSHWSSTSKPLSSSTLKLCNHFSPAWTKSGSCISSPNYVPTQPIIAYVQCRSRAGAEMVQWEYTLFLYFHPYNVSYSVIASPQAHFASVVSGLLAHLSLDRWTTRCFRSFDA